MATVTRPAPVLQRPDFRARIRSVVLTIALMLAAPSAASGATLLHQWKADNNFNDSVGTNTGSAVGDTTFAAGHDGQAFSFDGSGDQVSVPDLPDHYFAGSFTMDAWVKTTNTSGTQVVAGKYECANFCPGGMANTAYILYVIDGSVRAEVRDADGGGPDSDEGQSVVGGAVADGAFHHLALIRDNEAAKLALYIDGVVTAEEDLDPGAAGAFGNTDSEADPFTIGSILQGGTNTPFQELTGLVDDVRLWDGAEYPDKTPPTVTPIVSGQLGNQGFYRGDVTVTWSVVDAQSNIRSSTGCGVGTVTSDTAGAGFSCLATSPGGSATQSVTVKRDATGPVVTCETAPSFAQNQAPASVSASVSDSGSGAAAAATATAAADTSVAGSKTAAVTGTDVAGNATTVNCPFTVKPNADVAAATSSPACLSIPAVTRNQVAPVKRGGKVTLGTSQVDDPASPLKASVRFSGSGAIRSVAWTVNGKALEGAGRSVSVPVGVMRFGGAGNKLVAKVTLRDGRKVTVTQRLVVLRCPLPPVSCTRQGDGRTLKCSARTPLGARRVKVTVTRSATETAKGSATVTGGRYSVIVRSATPLPAGRYAYKHVATTDRRGQKFQMIRLVEVT